MSDQPSAGRGFPVLRTLGGSWPANGSGDGSRYLVTTAEQGFSSGPFARGNMADHVGDESGAVVANRVALQRELGATRGLAFIQAVHGNSVGNVEAPGSYPGVDALVTTTPGLGLVALGADCAVIGLHAATVDGGQVVGVAHCGWRGLVEDVIGAVVHAIRDAGGRQLDAVLGPAICGRCYRVNPERRGEVRDSCSPSVADAALVSTDVDDDTTPGLDVHAGAHQRLVELGVSVNAIGGCTFESESWFSFRRASLDPEAGGRTGRHALAVMINTRFEGDGFEGGEYGH